MQVGDDGRDREAPFEAEGQVDDDADDHQQQRHGAIVFGQFPCRPGTDESTRVQLGAGGFGFQGLHYRFAQWRYSVGLSGRRIITSREDPKFCTSSRKARCPALARTFEIGRLFVLDRDEGPPVNDGEATCGRTGRSRQDEGQQRNDVELQRMAHEGDVVLMRKNSIRAP